MGFGRGVGFTAVTTRFVGEVILTTVAGIIRVRLVKGKLLSSVMAVASAATPITPSTAGKLTTSKVLEVT